MSDSKGLYAVPENIRKMKPRGTMVKKIKGHKQEGFPLYIIQGAAHNANDDQPQQVNQLLNTFLQAL